MIPNYSHRLERLLLCSRVDWSCVIKQMFGSSLENFRLNASLERVARGPWRRLRTNPQVQAFSRSRARCKASGGAKGGGW